MANTIITIEIAEQIKAELTALVPSGTTIYADGVKDDLTAEEDEVKLPMVAIVVNELIPMQYRSVLRDYPVAIEAATWYPDDKDQVQLYTLAQAVTGWLAEPDLTLTLADWDALTIETNPERGVDGAVQYFRWEAVCKTRKATS